MEFLGSCDRLRRTEEGETFWQQMTSTSIPIPEKEFLSKVNIADLLDIDEAWENYKTVAAQEMSPIEFFKSDNAYFISRSGFEFIWKCNS